MAKRADDFFADDTEGPLRVAPRLALGLPGVFLTTLGNYPCILTNISRTGALIATDKPLGIGKDGFLRCGPIDHFVTVVRKEKGLNALEFEIPVTDLFVRDMRHYQESFPEIEVNELWETARRWAGVKWHTKD